MNSNVGGPCPVEKRMPRFCHLDSARRNDDGNYRIQLSTTFFSTLASPDLVHSPWSLHLSDQLRFVSIPPAMFGVKRQRDDDKPTELDPQNKVRSCAHSRRVLAQSPHNELCLVRSSSAHHSQSLYYRSSVSHIKHLTSLSLRSTSITVLSEPRP